MGDGETTLVPRLCHIVRWPDFNGYGFNLHAEKGKAGQFIGKIDEGSPAEAAGLKQGDRIVEVNGVNIGNENHQQVVGRIKAGGEETLLLVVDAETDQYYKEQKKVVKGDLPEVHRRSAKRDDTSPTESSHSSHEVDEHDTSDTFNNSYSAKAHGDSNGDAVLGSSQPDESSRYRPRLCHLCKWPDFDGYGFNLHAEKDKPGQYIGSVDRNSPAEKGGLKENDRIVEVNGDNIESANHSTVIQKIKSGGDRTTMLVVDKETDEYYKSRGQKITSSMKHVEVHTTPSRQSEEDRDSLPSREDLGSDFAEPPADLDDYTFVGNKRDYSPEREFPPLPEPYHSSEPESEEEKSPEVEQTVSDENDSGEVADTSAHVVASMQAASITRVTSEDRRPDPYAYEEIEIPSRASQNHGISSNGINGQIAEPVSEPKATKPVDSVPAPVIRSQTSAAVEDLNLNVSAAEMKERLKSRRKQDPRLMKTSFEQKHKMFEKL